MKEFLLASSVKPLGSPVSIIGKGVIIIGRFLLILLPSAYLIFALFFAGTGGASGVGLLFGVLVWLVFEFVGSIIFYIGKLGQDQKTNDENT
jgi:hypothetical protein